MKKIQTEIWAEDAARVAVFVTKLNVRSEVKIWQGVGVKKTFEPCFWTIS